MKTVPLLSSKINKGKTLMEAVARQVLGIRDLRTMMEVLKRSECG